MLNETEKMANRQSDQLMTSILKAFTTNLRHSLGETTGLANMLRVEVKEKQKSNL